MPVVISKAVKGASLGTSTADTQLAGATQKAPEWATTFLGFKAGGVIVTPTSTEAAHAHMRISSNDFACYPSTVLVPISQGAVATNDGLAAFALEYWPTNWPIHGGDAYDVQAQCEVANTVAPYAVATSYFGDAGAIQPSMMDSFPGVPRYYNITGYQAAASTAQAMTAITVTGARAILESSAYVLKPTDATAARSHIGRVQLNSNGFFTSPVDYQVEVTNGYLGASGLVPNPVKLTRENLQLPCGPTTIINAIMYDDSATAVTTNVGNVGICFIR